MKISNLNQGDRIWVDGNGPMIVHHVYMKDGKWHALVGSLEHASLEFSMKEDDEPYIHTVKSVRTLEVIDVRDADHLREILDAATNDTQPFES